MARRRNKAALQGRRDVCRMGGGVVTNVRLVQRLPSATIAWRHERYPCIDTCTICCPIEGKTTPHASPSCNVHPWPHCFSNDTILASERVSRKGTPPTHACCRLLPLLARLPLPPMRRLASARRFVTQMDLVERLPCAHAPRPGTLAGRAIDREETPSSGPVLPRS